MTFLSVTLKLVVVEVDGRGSGGLGEHWAASIRYRSGTGGVQDQINTVRSEENSKRK